MQHGLGHAPAPAQIEEAAELGWLKAFGDAIALNDRQSTPASRAVLAYTRCQYLSAALADTPTNLTLLPGGREDR